MSSNFILEFLSINSCILALTHAHAGKVVVCSLFRSHGPYINIQNNAYNLYDKLITATQAIEMHDTKMCKQNQATTVLFLKF